ncbi:transposase family protein [Streptomyces sp. NPDC048604]|uniref:transposase family protein n=1 Tax=Streptomyces sp. NPDC048604 TaxID=3365578 RepID=UPI0037158F1D
MDVKSSARAALSHQALSGTSRQHLAELVAELAPEWEAQRESALRERRGGDRRREAGAGSKHRLMFVDRVLVTLAHLRRDLPYLALAVLLGVDRSTVSVAIR